MRFRLPLPGCCRGSGKREAEELALVARRQLPADLVRLGEAEVVS